MLSLVGFRDRRKEELVIKLDMEWRKDEVEKIVEEYMKSLCSEILYYIVENIDRTIDKNLLDKFLLEDIEYKEEIIENIIMMHNDKIDKKSLYFMKSDLDFYITISRIEIIIRRLDSKNYIKKYRDIVEKIIRYGELNKRINNSIIREKVLDIFEDMII